MLARHARGEVARDDTRSRCRLEIAQRAQRDVDEHEVDDEAQPERDAEDRDRVPGSARSARAATPTSAASDDEQVRAGELAEQRHAQQPRATTPSDCGREFTGGALAATREWRAA